MAKKTFVSVLSDFEEGSHEVVGVALGQPVGDSASQCLRPSFYTVKAASKNVQ